jgi:HEAT repeat protein
MRPLVPSTDAATIDDRRVVDALRRSGLHVNSVYDLVNETRAYSSAIPVLVMHLPEVKDLGVKESIVRALSVKEARGLAGPALIREFRSLPHEGSERDAVQMFKWAVGNALSVVATESDYGDLVELLRDERHGKAREMLPIALARTGAPRAVEVLIDMLGDEQVAGHAITALGRLKALQAREPIERFLTDSRTWVRREAKKALERLAKS